MAKNKLPILPNIEAIIQAGINPNTGLPIKMGDPLNDFTENDAKKFLRIIDEQDAINRFNWYNLPDGINGELIERILYYRETGMFFYVDSVENIGKDSEDEFEIGKFYFLPYALNGGIDVYGQFKEVRPMPFNGRTENDTKEKDPISIEVRKPIYGVMQDDEVEWDDIVGKCVILHDYCKQYSQIGIPRQILQEPLLSLMAKHLPYIGTKLVASSGVKGFRVSNADDSAQVLIANRSIKRAALTGDVYVPITGTMDFQDLATAAEGSRIEDLYMSLQSLENIRLANYGLDHGGIFEKKAHVLESEQAMNQSNVGLVFKDALRLRQEFCNRVNSLFGLSIWVEPSEAVLGIDNNLDGYAYDIDDGSNQEGGQEDDTTNNI